MEGPAFPPRLAAATWSAVSGVAAAVSVLLTTIWSGTRQVVVTQVAPGDGGLVYRGINETTGSTHTAALLVAVLALVAGGLAFFFLLRRPAITASAIPSQGGAQAAHFRHYSGARLVLGIAAGVAMLAATIALVSLMRPRPYEIVLPGPTNAVRRVSLVVGVPEWREDPRLFPLPGAANDASAMARLWTMSGYHVIAPAPTATKAEILDSLARLVRTNKFGSFTLYWAGHGVAAGGKAYLLPANANLDRLSSTAITLEEISQVLDHEGAQFSSLRLLLDVCRVGADKLSAGFVETLSKSAGKWTLITSCSSGQLSAEICNLPKVGWQPPEGRVPHGLFTYLLIASRYGPLLGGQVISPADLNRDGKISWREAFLFAEKSLPQLGGLYSRGQGEASPALQAPRMFGDLSEKTTEEVFCNVEAIQENRNSDVIAQDQILYPQVDSSNRFLLYSDMKDDTIFTFVPYAWFCTNWPGKPLSPEAWAQMMQFDINCVNRPYGDQGTCVSWTVHWQGHTTNGEPWRVPWAGVGWVSGPDLPAWWAGNGDNRGRYYNLERPRKFKSLRFKAYSPDAGTCLTVKVGILSEDAGHNKLILGDSLSAPIEKRFYLTDQWAEYELPLEYTEALRHQFSPEGHSCVGSTSLCRICGNNPLNPKTVANMLERVCSFAFVFEKLHQHNTNSTARVFIDDVLFAALPQQ